MLNMLNCGLRLKAKITYINEGGYKCSAFIENPNRVDHTWYSSKRNILGKFEKHEVTIFSEFMNKLKNCKILEVVIGDDVTP